MISQPATYHRHRFPADIISHAIWLYHVFNPSLRDIELILAERGVGRDLRERPTLVSEIRPGLREQASAAAGETG